MTVIVIRLWTILTAATPTASGFAEWQAPIRKAMLDTNHNGYIDEHECMCELENDLFTPQDVTGHSIDYSSLKKYEAIARSIAAALTALNGNIDPQDEIHLLSDMLYQDTRHILGCWLGYTPDSYATAFNRSYNMSKSVKLVSSMDCGHTGACDHTEEHTMQNLTVRFIEQLGRNATLHHPYIYAKGCCNPVSFGDHLGNAEWAWMWNYFDPDPIFEVRTLPLRDYLYGNTTWLDVGRWSDPYVDPVAGVMISFGVPYVTRIPMPGSVDPFVLRDTRHIHPGFMKSFEGLYVMGVAGLDVRLGTIVLACGNGFYSTYPNCSECPTGMYRTVDNPADRCLECAPGFFADKMGSTACQPCGPGHFQSVEGRTLCDGCPPGTAQSEYGRLHCVLCALGSSMDTWNASDCSHCPFGWYANERGTGACLQCPETMSTRGIGSISGQDCVCSEGFFLSAASHRCERCPLEIICVMGSMDPTSANRAHTLMLLPGYYSSVDDPLTVYFCADDIACPGGLPGECGGGHIGLACHLCEAGRYPATTTGACETCASAAIGPFLTVVFLGLISAVMSHSAMNFPLLMVKRTTMAAIFLAGLVVTTVLTFNVYATLNTLWSPPISDLIPILRLVVFDLRILRFACIAGTSRLVPRYAFKLAMIPSVFLFVWLMSFLLRCIKWTRDYAFFSTPALINTGGLLFSIFFITVSLASLEGFMCIQNPGGKETLFTDRSVLCWASELHSQIVIASIIALCVYPLSFLAITIFCIWQYYVLTQRFGTKFALCMRFLVNRWNPDQYYFGTIYTMRNFALTIAPITQLNNYDMQVTLLQLVFLSWLAVQLSCKPWRFDVLNKFDAITSAMQLIVLNFLGLMSARRMSSSLSARGAGFIALATVLFVMSFTFLASLLHFVYRFRKFKEYGLFLSHHKGADAIYARQIKLMLASVTTRQVFLDVDNLVSLDELIFVVSSCVDNLLVMLSPETLYRFWCAVEIICATRNRVRIILMKTHPVTNFVSDEFLDKVPDMWGRTEILNFSKLGIDAIDDCAKAYALLAKLPIIKSLMRSSEGAQVSAIEKIVAVSKHCRTEKRTYKTESHQVSYVVYNTNCFVEATRARILCMLMKTNRWNCSILSDEFTKIEVTQSVMIILISAGLSRNPIALGHVCFSTQRGVPFTTVLSKDDYQRSKPSNDYMEQLQEGKAFTEEQLTCLHRIAPGMAVSALADVVLAIYACLAARFDPQDGEHMLLAEIRTICRRAEMHLEDFATGASTPHTLKNRPSARRDSGMSAASQGSGTPSKRSLPLSPVKIFVL